MKNPIIDHRAGFIVLSMTLMFMAGCYEFDYVNQTGSAQPDSSFVVQISATTTDGNGYPYIPYFGVLLPVGWTVQDSIGFICNSIEGTFVYSDSLSLEMENLAPPPENYFWWVAAGIDSVIYNLDDTYLFNPVILTDGQTGHFYLSYMLGSNSQSYGGLGERISGNHLITIGLPAGITVTSPANDGPGSLRDAIDNIDSYGTITFDLDQNDTIKLAEPLEVKKDCRITGPVNNTLVITGDDVTRIFHISSSPEISNLLLTRGFSDAGGAIYCDRSSPVLKDLIITGNTAKPGISEFSMGGGGIYCYHASPILENVTINNNSSNSGGGGVFFYGECTPVFDSINRCDIYMNLAIEGNDIFVWSSDTIKVVLDTFSVLNPTSFHAAPISGIDFNILYGKIEQSNSDLYVAPGGNNSNNGLSAETPLRNIHAACVKILADSLNPHTIHLSGGMYGPSLNGELFPVCLPDYVDLTGDTVAETVLDGEGMSTIVALRSGIISSHRNVNKLSWLTLKHGITGLNCYESNSCLENVNIADNTGLGVSCKYADMIIKNCTIVDNTEGGLWFEGSSPLLENVMISRNGGSYTGGIRFDGYCNAVLHDVSIIGNRAENGGGIVTGVWTNDPVSVSLNKVIIRDNIAKWGGGIYCERSDFNLSEVTIVNNSATACGGGICYVHGNDMTFDTLNRCNIHSNRAFEGNDFYNSPGHIVVDTFSVLNPTEFHVFQAGNTTYDILHGKYAQTNSDLFVSPAGDNNNSGLTPEEPLKNIHCAMSKMLPAQPQTIRLLDGVYSPSGNNEFFPVRMYNKINISGASKANVILNAEQTGGVINVENISSPRLSDMTITGGETSDGGGIECRSSSLSMKNMLITDNKAEHRGGGLDAMFCNPVIEDCDFIANFAGAAGGGVSFIQSKPVLRNVRVSDNLSLSSGGGIYCQEKSQLTMKDVSILWNTAMVQGGGISTSWECMLLFDETDRCNIYFNRAAKGGDVYSEGPSHIVLDTFTVMNPMKFHASPLQNFTFDIRNSVLEQANADLFVSPEGDNSKSGLSETEALKDIFIATMKIKTESSGPRTIHLLEGTYSSSSNAELFPVFLPDYTLLKGSSPGSVFLDAEEQNTVVRLLEKSNILLSGMTIQGGSNILGGGIRCEESNLSLKDVVISDNEAWRGGAIYASNSTLSLCDAQVIENTSRVSNGNSPQTPGIYMFLSDAMIENSVIAENEALGFVIYPTGIGLDCLYSGILLRNSTVTGNTSNNYGSYQPYWPAGVSFYESKPILINSIIFGNYPKEVHFETSEPDTITVSYSDIRGGMGGIILSGDSSYVNWLEGNIDEDPLFAGEGEHPFMLSATSPCRNAGTPDTTGMLLPLRDLAGGPRIWDDRIDIGAYEWNNVSINEFFRDSVNLQISVFPNPFSSATTIRYYLEENGPIMIRIFNLHGQQISEPLNACQERGMHEMNWEAKDLPSGIYLYRIHAGNKTGSGKLVKQ